MRLVSCLTVHVDDKGVAVGLVPWRERKGAA